MEKVQVKLKDGSICYGDKFDQNDYLNTMFCEYDNEDGLEEVVDSEIIEQLLKKFQARNEN